MGDVVLGDARGGRQPEPEGKKMSRARVMNVVQGPKADAEAASRRTATTALSRLA